MIKEKIYLVGGAVRDSLLGLPVGEKDWVVVGGSSKKLISAGYKQVGKDFPVFLHPDTKEEYALARVENKKSGGYTGFEFNTGKSVSLETDLRRRDLTINAIAKDSDGKLIDPWGGQKDIEQKILRHVSAAFIEDPLRVLRTARFGSKFFHLGFSIAPETFQLMCEIVNSGEIKFLKPDRVWKEISKALETDSPHIFFEVVRDCGALPFLFPSIPKYYLETIELSLLTLQRSTILSNDPRVRFASLYYELTKTFASNEEAMEIINLPISIPNKFKNILNGVKHLAPRYLEVFNLNGIQLAHLLMRMTSLKGKDTLSLSALACEAIFDHSFSKDKDSKASIYHYLMRAWDALNIASNEIDRQTDLKGKDYGKALFQARANYLSDWIRSEADLI